MLWTHSLSLHPNSLIVLITMIWCCCSSCLYGGLAQPDANWAKHAGPSLEGMGSGKDAGGRMFSRLPGQHRVIALGDWVRGHLLDHAATLPDLYIITLPTDRVLYQTSRVFSITHPPEATHAPSLTQRDTSVVTISPGKGSDHLTKPSVSGTVQSKGGKLFAVISPPIIIVIFLSSVLPFKLYLAIS